MGASPKSIPVDLYSRQNKTNKDMQSGSPIFLVVVYNRLVSYVLVVLLPDVPSCMLAIDVIFHTTRQHNRGRHQCSSFFFISRLGPCFPSDRDATVMHTGLWG